MVKEDSLLSYQLTACNHVSVSKVLFVLYSCCCILNVDLTVVYLFFVKILTWETSFRCPAITLALPNPTTGKASTMFYNLKFDRVNCVFL